MQNINQIAAYDPGSNKMGISILEYLNNKITCIYSEQKKLKGETLTERLADLYQFLESIFIKFPNVKELAIEKTFVDKNFTFGINSPLVLSMCRGVANAAAGKFNIKCFEYDNRIVKSVVCGNANITHRQMISRITKIIKKEVQDDEAFAIAIGITHILEKIRANPQQLLTYDQTTTP